MGSEKHSHVLNYGLSATANDAMLNRATTTLNMDWRVGSLKIDGSSCSLGGRADSGRFSVLRADLVRLQQLGGRFGLYLRVQGQWSDDNLDDSEKLYIGGVFGVRSARQTAACGNRGWLANAELRYALSDSWQLATFVEHGAAGFGARGADRRWSISAQAGWKVGDHPAQSDTERQSRI